MVRYPFLWIPAFLVAFLLVGIDPVHAQPTTTDVAVTEILVPGDAVPAGQPVTVEFELANLGANPADNFFCGVAIFDQANPGTPIFQNQITVPLLLEGTTVTVQATQPWSPPGPGAYNVQIVAVYEFDNTPTNNQLAKDFQITAPGLLTLAQAIDILNTEVLDGHPRADSLVALHLSPPANPADSLIPPGVPIISADSMLILRYDYPVYFFFIDLYPDQLYSHPVEYVAISAIDGAIDRHIDQELWPDIDGVTPDFGAYCFGDANPRRVRGGAVQCVEKADPYQPVATSNTDSWALVVVGKLNLDIEKSTVQHDICKWKERINGNTMGPQVTGPNISAHAGTNNCGLTEQELCDAIDALKGKGCDKVHFKYIGHGTQSGIIVWDKNHRNSSTLSWSKLAKKLKEAGFAEVCLEITACHSGAAISALKREGIKGTVITSSSASRTTPVGDGSGTHWEKALEECSKDQNADLNRNNKIDACELYAWVIARGGSAANGPNPQIEKLNDSVKFVSAKTDIVGSKRSISTNGGPIRVYAERVCMKLKVKTGGRQRDSTVYRGSVYIENDGGTDRGADRDYRITARCGRKDSVIVERIRPSLRPGEKQCIADLPNDCTGITVERIRNGIVQEKDDVILSAAPDESFSTVDEIAAHNPGEFVFFRYEYEWDNSTDPHSASVLAPPGWDAGAGPAAFFVPAAGTEDVFTGVLIPDTATAGGTVSTALINTATSDTLQINYNVLLLDTIEVIDINASLTGSGRWYDAVGTALLKPFSTNFDNVHIETRNSLDIEAVGSWRWRNVTVGADSGVSLTTSIGLGAASTRMENVAVRGSLNGIAAVAGNIIMRGVTVGASGGNGFHFRGNRSLIDTVTGLRLDTLEFLNVLGADGNGIVFDDVNARHSATDTVTTVRWLRVEFADSSDVVVRNNSHVRCVDCSYRENAVVIDGSSSVQRYATLSVAAVDTAGNGLAGIDVTVADSTGRTLFNGITDSDGFVPNLELLLSRYDRNGYRSFQPFVVTADNGTVQLHDTLRLTTYRQLIFELEKRSMSVPVAGERTANAAIVRIVPQPVDMGKELVVHTEGLGTSAVNVSLHNALGETVWRRDGVAVVNDRLVVRGFDVAPGMYVLRLHPADGSFVSAKIVVR